MAAWHFPQVPALLAFARQTHALLLVAQDVEWLEPLKAAGCTLNFSFRRGIALLEREMASGRVIATMLDHTHPGTKCEETTLFGRPARTPSGVLELAARHSYLLAFIAPRGEDVQVTATLDASGKAPQDLARAYASWLEAEVRRAPEDWLMWAAFPSSLPPA